MLSVVMMIGAMLSVVILVVEMPGVFMLSVIILNVVGPWKTFWTHNLRIFLRIS